MIQPGLLLLFFYGSTSSIIQHNGVKLSSTVLEQCPPYFRSTNKYLQGLNGFKDVTIKVSLFIGLLVY